jgi:hypothetical protein
MSYASENADALGATARISVAHPRDFFALLKPRVMYLVILTALAGLLVSPGHLHPLLGFVSLLAIAVGAGASGALNMWYDADIDARMTRTSRVWPWVSQPASSSRLRHCHSIPLFALRHCCGSWVDQNVLGTALKFCSICAKAVSSAASAVCWACAAHTPLLAPKRSDSMDRAVNKPTMLASSTSRVTISKVMAPRARAFMCSHLQVL